jgi:hypothetical protein
VEIPQLLYPRVALDVSGCLAFAGYREEIAIIVYGPRQFLSMGISQLLSRIMPPLTIADGNWLLPSVTLQARWSVFSSKSRMVRVGGIQALADPPAVSQGVQHVLGPLIGAADVSFYGEAEEHADCGIIMSVFQDFHRKERPALDNENQTVQIA